MKPEGRQSDGDLHLLRRAGRGDAGAFARLYEKYFQTVTDFLASRDGRPASPEDLAQEVFLRAWKQADRFRGDSSAKTYLLGIARNVLRQAQRGSYRADSARSAQRVRLDETVGRRPGESGLTPVELSAHRRELQAELVKRIFSLPPNSREAIELAALRGLSSNEAAIEVGCSQDAFRMRLHRAVQALRGLGDTPP